MPFCTACGTQNPDDARFCAQCGTRLVTPGAGTPSTPAPSIPSPETYPSAYAACSYVTPSTVIAMCVVGRSATPGIP